MAAFKRAHVETLVSRLHEQPYHLIAVFGPRQSGKTTIVQQALQTMDRPSVLVPFDNRIAPKIQPTIDDTTVQLPRQADLESLVSIWQKARAQADRDPRGFILALDEIQTIPNWSQVVKGLWDSDRATNRPLHVIVLGSAPMSIQSSLKESLAGRFELLRVTHWSFDEMSDAFGYDLDQYLFFGGYPGGAKLVREEERWQAYIQNAIINSTIERDVLAMTRVDQPALLKQFFEFGSLYSGQILSYNKMLGTLTDAGNTTTLARYLDLLSTLNLLTGFRKYTPSKLRIRESSPKLNVCNTALMTVTSDYTFDQARADRTFWGRLVESAVGAHMFNTAPTNVKVYYWRGRVGRAESEVDYVIQQGPLTIAIEVKSNSNSRRLPGLEAFAQKFDPSRTLLVGGNGIPIGEFLATPVIRWFDGI